MAIVHFIRVEIYLCQKLMTNPADNISPQTRKISQFLKLILLLLTVFKPDRLVCAVLNNLNKDRDKVNIGLSLVRKNGCEG